MCLKQVSIYKHLRVSCVVCVVKNTPPQPNSTTTPSLALLQLTAYISLSEVGAAAVELSSNDVVVSDQKSSGHYHFTFPNTQKISVHSDSIDQLTVITSQFKCALVSQTVILCGQPDQPGVPDNDSDIIELSHHHGETEGGHISWVRSLLHEQFSCELDISKQSKLQETR